MGKFQYNYEGKNTRCEPCMLCQRDLFGAFRSLTRNDGDVDVENVSNISCK